MSEHVSSSELKSMFEYIDNSDYDLNDYELEFLQSIQEFLETRGQLTVRQEGKLFEIFGKVVNSGLGPREGIPGRLLK